MLWLGLVDPLAALAVSFGCLGIMVYKRVNLGLTLIITAILLSLLSMEPTEIRNVFFDTSTDLLTISLVSATFGVMLLSQLHKETGVLEIMSESLGRLLKNPKLVAGLLPAVIGLLPVAGGALLSAPLIEDATDKLELKEDKKAYVNIWFRHTIFPVYPISQVLILTATLTNQPLTSLIVRQIPVVISMVLVGYLVALWKAPVRVRYKEDGKSSTKSVLKTLAISFSAILTMIFVVVVFGVNVSIAIFMGIGILLLITRPGLRTFLRSFRSTAVYWVTIAAYGAMLLRNVIIASGISDLLGRMIANGNVSEVMLLLSIPPALGFLVGSPYGGIAISVPMLTGVLNFGTKAAGLLYVAAYLGYLGAPTHLCLVLTADYFKCRLGRLYKYLLPSLLVSFAAAILVYYLL